VHKNHNSKLHTFGVIALYSFSFLNFARGIRINKNISLVPVTCPQNIGRVGSDFFIFFY